jgi:Ni,Fe-hydrogenase III component G
VILLEQVISDSEITAFKKYFQDNFDKKHINWQTDDQVIDHRLNIDKNSELFKIINRIVSNNFKSTIHFWSAYQRQSRPHNIHIDDYKSDQKNAFRYTYILAMDSVPEFKSIIWKETCWDNSELHNFAGRWGELGRLRKKVSNISETQDLEHTIDKNHMDYMADYLTLDGIYTYKTGTACLFNATQLHCTSNWLKYNKFPYRELLQIHVLSAEPIDC